MKMTLNQREMRFTIIFLLIERLIKVTQSLVKQVQLKVQLNEFSMVFSVLLIIDTVRICCCCSCCF